jgi:hypothetical protein
MTTAQLAATWLNLNEARCEALFASGLQPSDAPTADMVAEVINYTCSRSALVAALGRWRRSSATIPTRPRSECVGCVNSTP